jgi:hypothetical protein
VTIGIEQIEQHQHAVLVVMQTPITGPVAPTALLVQSFQQRRKLLEILQPRDIGLFDLLSTLSLTACHAPHCVRYRKRAQA